MIGWASTVLRGPSNVNLMKQATQPSEPSYRLIPLTQGQFAIAQRALDAAVRAEVAQTAEYAAGHIVEFEAALIQVAALAIAAVQSSRRKHNALPRTVTATVVEGMDFRKEPGV